MSKIDRLHRLLPGGYPRYVRCYDAGLDGPTDRYTVVFNGRYGNRLPRSERRYYHMGMSAQPFHPQGYCHLADTDHIIDLKDGRWSPGYGDSNHLGKRIHWHELPVDCQKAALHVYKELWDLYVDETKVKKKATLMAGIPGGVRIISARKGARERRDVKPGQVRGQQG